MNEREIQTEDLMRGNAFMFHNYIEMESAERDKAVFKLVIRPESKNPYGIVHGGAIYTMADNAAGAVAHSDGRYYVTQTSSLHFLRNRRRALSGRRPVSGTGASPLAWWTWILPARAIFCWLRGNLHISVWTST